MPRMGSDLGSTSSSSNRRGSCTITPAPRRSLGTRGPTSSSGPTGTEFVDCTDSVDALRLNQGTGGSDGGTLGATGDDCVKKPLASAMSSPLLALISSARDEPRLEVGGSGDDGRVRDSRCEAGSDVARPAEEGGLPVSRGGGRVGIDSLDLCINREGRRSTGDRLREGVRSPGLRSEAVSSAKDRARGPVMGEPRDEA